MGAVGFGIARQPRSRDRSRSTGLNRAPGKFRKDSASDKGTNPDNKGGVKTRVAGLSKASRQVGTTPTIAPLLEAMHNDPSPVVRERAACSLAESGMLTHEQRLTAVPQLINYSDDPALDSQTHAWAFQALNDITKQHLPNNSAAWRNWYQNTDGQRPGNQRSDQARSFLADALTAENLVHQTNKTVRSLRTVFFTPPSWPRARRSPSLAVTRSKRRP